ncbi:MAG TPA: class GN sortase [Dokdonella sp.]|uniref:class GN sortase n=1 Tax=Dokdonella sp. TaxID=2291710 RepID=UPI002D7E1A9E|nr:class GN sortase [Dokdonella sp.]HET9032667.1 class GN sortase [Dokdonella sp.]
MTAKLLRRTACLLALCACMPLSHAAYMNAKAELAQVLLQRAWQQRLQTGDPAKPWPWADTSPVARLKVARLGIDEIVLSGDSGRTLAFGPGWAESTAIPGTPGLSVVSAHRDTHFAFLRNLRIGDRIEIDNADGSRMLRVTTMRIADSSREHIGVDNDANGLMLVTCYPFDALTAGGPLRFVVTAVPEHAS